MMKRDRTEDTDPMNPVLDALGGCPEPLHGASSCGHGESIDAKTASILQSLDRPPRPPATAPERRPSSDGGDFVAYSAVAHPANKAARTNEERRRHVLADLAVLVEEPHPAAPPDSLRKDDSTYVPPSPVVGRWRWALATATACLFGIALLATASQKKAPAEGEPIGPATHVQLSAEASEPVVAPRAPRVEAAPAASVTAPPILSSSAARAPLPRSVPRVTAQTVPSARSDSDRLVEHPW